MNKLLIGGAAAALVSAIVPAVAQPAPPPGVAQGTAPAAPVAPGTQRVHMMVMSDKVMTRAEVDQHVRKLFERFDANRDGFITRDEIASLGQRMTAMHGDMEKKVADRGTMMGDRNAIFDRLDANHDGSISRQEFLAGQTRVHTERMIIRRGGDGAAPGQPPMHGMREMHMRGMGMGMGGFGGHLFEMADANHDGRVSLQEAESAALAHFDRADLNRDGRLTPEERQQAHRQMREHRPS